jgi:mRNA interferase HigB
MRVISVARLREFWVKYPDSEQQLKAWFDEVSNASWESPDEIKMHYRSASILKAGRVVFNIGGNKYRLVVAVSYRTQFVLIKFVGTHEQYNKIDVQTIEAS